MSGLEIVSLAPGSITFLPFRPSFHLPLRFVLNTTRPSASSPTLSCHVHLDISVPDAVFFDRDELRNGMHLFEWTLKPEVIDIERPVNPQAPLSHLYLRSTESFEAEKESYDLEGGGRKVKIPMHARYLKPKEEGLETIWLFSGGQSGTVRAGWVCGEASGLSVEPDLPEIRTLPLPLTLPTGRPSHENVTAFGTTAVVWSCFLYLAWKIWGLSNRLSRGRVKEKQLQAVAPGQLCRSVSIARQ